jgi:hypothetical protein
MAIRRTGPLGLVVLVGLALAVVPSVASASTIQMYGYDGKYHNDFPCIFAGNNGCPQNPLGWPAPTQSTSNDWGASTPGQLVTLTRAYTGTDLTSWMTIIGSSFVLGMDFNSNVTHAELNVLTIDFRDGSNNQLGYWSFPSPTVTPDINNGTGKWDYTFGAGCAGTLGTVTASDSSLQTTCSQYLPFVIPAGTATMTFQFGYKNSDDGDDDLFAVPYTTEVIPEPATLLLVGGGLLLGASRMRRRKA